MYNIHTLDSDTHLVRRQPSVLYGGKIHSSPWEGDRTATHSSVCRLQFLGAHILYCRYIWDVLITESSNLEPQKLLMKMRTKMSLHQLKL